MAGGPGPFQESQYTVEFKSNYELLLQQMVSKLRGLVDSASYKGREAAMINQMAALQFRQRAGQYSPLQFQISTFTRPWVQPNDKELAVPFDSFDALKSIADPRGTISQATTAAANRVFDDTIIAAAFGTVQRGEDPSNFTAESFPSTVSTTTSASAPYGGFVVADTFGSGASVGQTYNKLREMRRVLEHYENDLMMESVGLIQGSQQNSDLLGQTEVIDKRFNEKAVVERGIVTDLLGCNIVSSERLQTSSSNALRNCIGFVRSGLHLGIWNDLSVRVNNRTDLSGEPWQLYAMISVGAVRTQLGKVIQVNCADTTGGDITP